ncbi:MAG: phosphate signaling complex protein PhoU [Anaerolineae bacterium]|nr:phosphate signaling complex protein PhoU [Anaerolineae bacterium]
MTELHTKVRSSLDEALLMLRDDVLKLSFFVDQALDHAVRALREQNIELARQVISDDDQINALRYAIERQCYLLLALQQPAARDMRAVITAIHIVVELERMGDHAASIAKTAEELASEAQLKPLIDIPRMAQIAREMLKASLSAYLSWSAEEAEATVARDVEVDQLDAQLTRELVTFMLQDTGNINRALKLQWASHNLERIADRITNICERVIFMVTGDLTELDNAPQH